MCKKLTLAIVLLLALEEGATSTEKVPQPAPTSTVDLAILGYSKANPVYPSNKESFRDLTLLMQDEDSRLSFVSGNVLAVYFNRPSDKTEAGASATPTYRMEVFFLNLDSGKLIEHRTWTTLKRQWFNDSYDTEGRIMEVHAGFLVHASGKLELYSPDLRLVRSHDLRGDSSGPTGMWSVAVAPGGDTIHIQPSAQQASQVRHGSVSYFTGEGEAEGSWLRSDSFEKIGSQLYFGGPDSISNDALVTKRAHCLDLQRIGERSRHLSCSKPAADGIPMFLNDREILSVHYAGFSLLSTQGTEAWTVGGPDPGIRRTLLVGSHQRSMDGSRFAISLTAYKKKVEFDGIPVARSPLETMAVYDETCRRSIFSVSTPEGRADSVFALSPDGRTLAVLAGATVSIYRLPEATCR
jgi:hypothetical protein